MTASKSLPDDHPLKRAHDASSHNRKFIEASRLCGCFYCKRTFRPSEIIAWWDEGQTAVCPYCSIDSVIGDHSVPEISEKFLDGMKRYWF